MSARAGGSDEGGFSLIEVLVAVILVAIVMSALFPVTFKVALQSRQANVVAQQSAAMDSEISRINTTDFASLTTGTTCETFSASGFPHTKCVTVSDINPNRKQVTVTITPLNGSGVEPTTTVTERSRSSGGNPLNTP